jgi:hypothetical protein
MHGPIKVKFPNNTSKWQIGFNSAFKGLKEMGAIIMYETGNQGKGRGLFSCGSVQVLWPSVVNMLCFEDKESFEILLALDFYLCNICTQ